MKHITISEFEILKRLYLLLLLITISPLCAQSAITKYMFPNQTLFTPFVGGGVGLNFGKGDMNSSFDLAIHILGGLSVPVTSRLNGLLELKYSMDGADYFGIFLGMDYQIR